MGIEEYVNNQIPYYVTSNRGYYAKLAYDFFEIISGAKDKETYEKVFSMFCREHMKDLASEDVQKYLMCSGIMESETVEEIRQFYLDNAEPFQQSFLSAGLESGKRYTLVYISDTGFPVADKITFIKMAPCQYAQYTDSICMTFVRAKCRKEIKKYFYPISIAIYEGWLDLKREDYMDKIEEKANVTAYRSKYNAFDSRYFTDVVDKFGTPLVEYKNFRQGVNGCVYA